MEFLTSLAQTMSQQVRLSHSQLSNLKILHMLLVYVLQDILILLLKNTLKSTLEFFSTLLGVKVNYEALPNQRVLLHYATEQHKLHPIV